jgi:hypothetical protein
MGRRPRASLSADLDLELEAALDLGLAKVGDREVEV